MKTYEVNQLDGRSFKVNDVMDIWDSEHGVVFQGEGSKTIAFIPFKNLANYQLVVEKTVTSAVKTIVGDTAVTFDGNTLHLSADKINLGGAVLINSSAEKENDENPLAIITAENVNSIRIENANGKKKLFFLGEKFIGEIIE